MGALGFYIKEVGVCVKLAVRINGMVFYSSMDFETYEEAEKYAKEHGVECGVVYI